MIARPSLRSTVTTLAAAAVLVGGADLASYAATGNAFVLGHSNTAGTTTALKNTGRGPALSLNSAKNVPPLVVNSSTLVKHLNANEVGGLKATQLSPNIDTYRVGSPGGSLAPTEHFFKIKSPSGPTEIGVHGIWEGATTGDEMQCLVLDQRLLSTMDLSLIYSLPTATDGDPNGNIIDETTYVNLPKHKTLVFGCQNTGASDATIIQPITFTFRSVPTVTKHGRHTTFPKSAAKHILGR
jgi:hypothetical protein